MDKEKREARLAQMKRSQQSRQKIQEEEARRKASRGKSSAGGIDYGSIAYVALEHGNDTIVRITSNDYNQVFVGNSIEIERTDPSDAYPFEYSLIRTDSGQWMHCTGPKRKTALDRSWILREVYKLITEYEWDSVANKKVFKYEMKYPELFNRVTKNGMSPSAKGYAFNKGWFPSSFVALNVIDRMDKAYHQEHKKTKLIAYNMSTGAEGKKYPKAGLHLSTYEKILLKDIQARWGDWLDYDVILQSFPDDPYYKILHGDLDQHHLIDSQNSKFIVKGFLTDEEEQYEQWDLEKVHPVTRYSLIQRNLGIFFDQVDKIFKTTFVDKLETLVKEEKEKRGTSSDEQESAVSMVVDQEVPRRVAPQETRSLTEEDFKKLTEGAFHPVGHALEGQRYAGLTSLTLAEKAMIIGIKPDGQFIYSEKNIHGEKTVLSDWGPNEDSFMFRAPNCFEYCPFYGEKFSEVAIGDSEE